MDKETKKFLRSILFRHLDGIALCGPISALNKNGVTRFILSNPSFSIQDILNNFGCNSGYLNITLRLLASQGWLTYNIIEDGLNIQYTLTPKGKECLALAHHYDQFADHFNHLINIDDILFDMHPNPAQKELNILIELLNLKLMKH